MCWHQVPHAAPFKMKTRNFATSKYPPVSHIYVVYAVINCTHVYVHV